VGRLANEHEARIADLFEDDGKVIGLRLEPRGVVADELAGGVAHGCIAASA
jgi:hypothetical protein